MSVLAKIRGMQAAIKIIINTKIKRFNWFQPEKGNGFFNVFFLCATLPGGCDLQDELEN